MSDADKIAALEGEVARLRGELAKYKPAPVVVKVDSAFCLPDEETVERLIHRVHARYRRSRDGGEVHVVASGSGCAANASRTAEVTGKGGGLNQVSQMGHLPRAWGGPVGPLPRRTAVAPS
jgi:hypothetical protein